MRSAETGTTVPLVTATKDTPRASFPAIKALDQCDFNLTTSAPRKQIMELAVVFGNGALVAREGVRYLEQQGVKRARTRSSTTAIRILES
jgi:hypothetical protein